MSLDTAAKVTVSIGPATRCTTEAEFKALTGWKAVTNIEDVGEQKADRPIATGKYLDQDYVRKLAGGPRDAGTQTMVFGYDPDDDGQTALQDADLANESYAVKIELPDAPTGGTPTTWYFMAIIGPVSLAFSDGSAPIKLTVDFNIDGRPIKVAAAAA